MKVILKKDVPSLGYAGDIKKVKGGYARNYLIPNDLVFIANPNSIKQQKFINEIRDKKVKETRIGLSEIQKQLNEKEFYIEMNVGENKKMFGSITNILIHDVLQKHGFSIERKTILLDKPIKSLGSYTIPIKLYENIQCKIHIVVKSKNKQKDITENNDNKQKDITENNDNKQKDITENNDNKQKDITENNDNKQKDITENNDNKQKDIIENNDNKQKDITKNNDNKQKDIIENNDNKQKDITKNNDNKQKDITKNNDNKQKDIIENNDNKQKDIIENNDNKQKDIIENNDNKQKEE